MMPTPSPFFDYRPEYRLHAEEIDAAIRGVIASGQLILGPEVEQFESEFASYIGRRGGVGVGTGTDAIALALQALEIGVGDEVITVTNAGVPPVAAIRMAGAEPVFVDVCESSLTIDPEAVRSAISERTRAILVVHLYGNVADLDRLTEIAEEHQIALVEDCAQAHGATLRGRRVGSFGRLGCFSFYPTKNLGALGDGGMVVTDDESLLEKLRQLRMYGYPAGRREARVEGNNSRLDELQAAILRVKLRHLDETNAERARLAESYGPLYPSGGRAAMTVRAEAERVHHLCILRHEERGELRRHCAELGLPTATHYAEAVDRMTPYQQFRVGPGGLQRSSSACDEVLSLPLYVGMPERLVEIWRGVVETFRR